MNRKNKNQKGFTLIELMVTVAVAIILLGVGIPLFDTMMANNRAVTQNNSFVTAINLARSEAVSKNITSTICAFEATDDYPDDFDCGASDDWTNGWFVFNDEDADSDYDNGETVIKIWAPLVNNADIDFTASDGSTEGVISFNSLGEKVSLAELSFRIAQGDGDGNIATSSQPRCIYLNAIGQLRTARATTDDGDPLKKGDPLSDATCL